MSSLDIKSFKRDLKKLKKGVNKGLTKGNEKATESLLNTILDRTAKSQGLKGTFPKYTKEYEKRKGSKKVNLRVSGDMLDSLKVTKKQNNTMLIEFADKKQEKKAEGVSKKRPFMGYTKKEWRNFENTFGKEFKRHI
jgi:hypothetical protein